MMSEPLAAILQALPRRFRSYPEYKDSGVEWLGEIPMHWKVQRLKFAAHIEAGQSPSSESVAAGADGLPFLQGNAEFGPRHPVPHLVCNEASKRAKVGDLLLSVRAPVGALNIADQSCGIGRGLCAITPGDDFEPQFCYYVLWAVRSRLDAVSTGSTYEAVTASDVGDVPALLPSRNEQRAIGAFLDRETAKIDALMAKKERVIELLQEKRIALITQTVTKGLDPNVPMKDSGVEWLGQIPAHWEVLPNAPLFRQRDFRGRGELPILEVSIASGVQVRDFATDRIEQRASDPATYKVACSGDIVFNKMRMWQGAVGVASVDGLVSPDYIVAEPRARASSAYFAALFRTSNYMAEVYRFSHGIVDDRNRLYWDDFKAIRSPVPPRDEQQAIVQHLELETAEIDALVAKVREAIERLKEFRTALISAVVTGKIDVREGAA
jgi:type I restriction enzyme S subunit